ncbi:FeoC-like transcriptional regulator [Spirulina subsalsa FACHB-351]|uniref:FeoC-like transcriptional regulator n=1 Tax=Spirulina subsalsa FACHB-351 TaxID=234711 RepID=A0ABT3L096_9CYAN|nr:FeoC-like transcriptional regulator [Spirulina subsalsa]MCW6034928.1 FeoC-like transcriptional regulator [Spirulina subsalsa FACHB-351]
MILTELQQYLRQHKTTTLDELSCHFAIAPDALRGMLSQLVRKGRVRQLETKKCGGCHSCSPEALELYEWVNSG